MCELQGNVICNDCSKVDIPNTKLSGTLRVELLLYCIGIIFAKVTFFTSLLIPIGYSIYRRSRVTKVCKECEGNVVSIHTTRSKKLFREMGFDLI
jgi:hypothetical protein